MYNYKLKNIILTGFMGSGKSSVGKMLSQMLGFEFLDTDKKIEEQTGHKISEIFNIFGEKYFRYLENQLIAKLVKKKFLLM